MKEEKLPTRYFIQPNDKFANDIILLNKEEGTLVATEERVSYKKESLNVWEIDLKSLKLLLKNKVSITGFGFKIYAKINDRVQSWRLLDFRKGAKAAKARKKLRQIGREKIAAKQQPPPR